MSQDIYTQFGIDKSRLKRDYQENPLITTKNGHGSEFPYKEDLMYLYIELNIREADLLKILGINRRKLQRTLHKLKITKDTSLIQQNMCNSKLERYGNAHFTNREKAKATCLERYGNEYYHNDEKRLKTCIARYHRPNNSGLHISDEAYEIITNEQLLRQYIKEHDVVNTIDLARKLKITESTACIYCRKYDLTKTFSHIKSQPERELIEYINQYIDTENNTKQYLHNKEIDIYVPLLKIGFEFNGTYWHSIKIKDLYYHQRKSSEAISKGIFLFNIFEYDWKDRKEQIFYEINKQLNIGQKISENDCSISPIASKDIRKFINENSLLKYERSKFHYGIFYQDILVAVFSYGKYITNICVKNDYVFNPLSNILNYIEIAFHQTFPQIKVNLTFENIFRYASKGYTIKSFLKPSKTICWRSRKRNIENNPNASNIIYDCGNVILTQ